MKKIIAFLSVLIVSCFAQNNPGRAFSHGAIPTIPSFASSSPLNLNHIIFFEQFNNINNFDLVQDLNNTILGKNWYTTGDQTLLEGCSPHPPPLTTWFSAPGGILNISNNNPGCEGAEDMSIGWSRSTNTANNTFTVPTGGGMYIEGSIQFFPAVGLVYGDAGTPDFWMQGIQLSTNQFLNSGGGGCEVDIVEAKAAFGNANTAESHLIAWTAWNNAQFISNAGYNASAIDFTQYHLWGALLTPMNKGAGTGSVQFYLDRVAVGTPIIWSSIDTRFAVCDNTILGINFAASSNPIAENIRYIVVYGP